MHTRPFESSVPAIVKMNDAAIGFGIPRPLRPGTAVGPLDARGFNPLGAWDALG